ncbi:MAG: recombinase family protein [Candidatus Omnitrophica bacterium]|nr:recombinase family protein [Candidatus Omnitrophota bacterium]
MRIAIYARVSTEKQEKQETINSQLQVLRDHAKKNNYIVSQEYVDNGYSGELLDRPALDKLRDDARKKLFEVVLVHSPDRLSRKFIYLGLLQEELKKYDINTVFLNRPDSKDTPEENLLNGVQGLIAEYEKAKILERTRRGKIHKAQSGILIGSIAPYGYRYVKNGAIGHYEINDQEAKIVKLIFNLFINKRLSIRSIAKELTRRNIPPRQGKLWRTSSLHRIIRNETYAGITYYNKHMAVESKNHNSVAKYKRAKNTSMRLRPREQWIPINLPDDLRIIDKDIFSLAQRQLKQNSESSSRNVKYRYLLRGLVKCGKCDSPFQGVSYHGDLYYRCGNRHRTFPLPRECHAAAARANDLENIVWNTFCDAIKDPYLISDQLVKLHEKNKSNNKINNIELIDKELESLRVEESRLLDAYRENIITMDQLKDQMAKVQDKRKYLEQDKRDLVIKQEKNLSMLSLKKTLQDYREQISRRLDKVNNDFESKRYLLSRALIKVTLDDKQVRIKGIIPVNPPGESALSNIASTTSGCCVRLQLLLPMPF